MAINYGDFCIVTRSSFSNYPTIIQFRTYHAGENCSCEPDHCSILKFNPMYNRVDDLKEIYLTDPLFIEIMETHVIREDIKKEFGEWLRAKLVAECGEEILKSTAKDFLKPEHSSIRVIESDEQLGFIHIND
jgi:hypothetical protein